jgi:hypothetical protein
MHAASTDDFDRWLVPWVQHNAGSKDPVGALMLAAERMGGRITEADAIAIIDFAKASPKARSADAVARQIGLTYLVREKLGITTIGSIDIKKRARKELRKRKARLREEHRRRARGAKPHSESLSRTQPWKALGISRSTWERRRKKAVDANSCAASLSFSPAQESASAERPQAGIRGGDCPNIEHQQQQSACGEKAAGGATHVQKSRPAWLKRRKHSGWFATFADAEQEYDAFRQQRDIKRTKTPLKAAWHEWCSHVWPHNAVTNPLRSTNGRAVA